MQSFHRIIFSEDASRPALTLKQRHQLGPIEKWRLYGTIPWKFLNHIALITIVVSLVFIRNPAESASIRNGARMMQRLFLPDGQWVDGGWASAMFTTQKVAQVVIASSQTYFSLAATNVDSIFTSVSNSTDFPVRPPLLFIELFDDIKFNSTRLTNIFKFKYSSATTTTKYTLSPENPSGPIVGNMTDEILKLSLFSRMASLRLVYKFVFVDVLTPACFDWTLAMEFNFRTQGGQVQARLFPSSRVCRGFSRNENFATLRTSQFGLCLAGLAVAIVAIFLGLRAVRRGKRLYRFADTLMRVKERKNKLKKPGVPTPPPPPDIYRAPSVDLTNGVAEIEVGAPAANRRARSNLNRHTHSHAKFPLAVRIGTFLSERYSKIRHALIFIRVSDVNSMISGILLFVFCILCNFTETPNVTLDAILGLLAIIALAQFSTYHNFFPQFFILNTVIEKSLPQIVNILLGIVPLFLAFLFSSLAFFSSYTTIFTFPEESAYNIFGFVNGDSVFSTFTALRNSNPILDVLSQIMFVFAFVIFNYMTIHAMVVVMEESHRLISINTENENSAEVRVPLAHTHTEEDELAFAIMSKYGEDGEPKAPSPSVEIPSVDDLLGISQISEIAENVGIMRDAMEEAGSRDLRLSAGPPPPEIINSSEPLGQLSLRQRLRSSVVNSLHPTVWDMVAPHEDDLLHRKGTAINHADYMTD